MVSARRRLPTGLALTLATDIKPEQVSLRIEWTSTGMEDRRNLGKYITGAASATSARLRAGGWRIERQSVELQAIHLVARIEASELRSKLGHAAATVDAAISSLHF